jgi:hypothetical protein
MSLSGRVVCCATDLLALMRLPSAGEATGPLACVESALRREQHHDGVRG